MAYSFVKLNLMNAVGYWTCSHSMKKLQGRLLIEKRLPCSLVETLVVGFKKILLAIFGPQILTNCERYLGLPMVGGKPKVNTFKEL